MTAALYAAHWAGQFLTGITAGCVLTDLLFQLAGGYDEDPG